MIKMSSWYFFIQNSGWTDLGHMKQISLLFCFEQIKYFEVLHILRIMLCIKWIQSYDNQSEKKVAKPFPTLPSIS